MARLWLLLCFGFLLNGGAVAAFFDPIPKIMDLGAKRGVAKSSGGSGQKITVAYDDADHSCVVIGKPVTSGAEVSVVFLSGGKYCIEESGGYRSTESKDLAAIAKQAPASAALRAILNKNPKDYLYRPSSIKDGVVGEPYNKELPCKFGPEEAVCEEGEVLICEIDNDDIHVIGTPEGGGGGGGGGSAVPFSGYFSMKATVWYEPTPLAGFLTAGDRAGRTIIDLPNFKNDFNAVVVASSNPIYFQKMVFILSGTSGPNNMYMAKYPVYIDQPEPPIPSIPYEWSENLIASGYHSHSPGLGTLAGSLYLTAYIDNQHKVFKTTNGEDWQQIGVASNYPGSFQSCAVEFKNEFLVFSWAAGKLYRTSDFLSWTDEPFPGVAAAGRYSNDKLFIIRQSGYGETGYAWETYTPAKIALSTWDGTTETPLWEIDTPVYQVYGQTPPTGRYVFNVRPQLESGWYLAITNCGAVCVEKGGETFLHLTNNSGMVAIIDKDGGWEIGQQQYSGSIVCGIEPEPQEE
jgi:hypothetical protein